jgi:hypothetical protein
MRVYRDTRLIGSSAGRSHYQCSRMSLSTSLVIPTTGAIRCRDEERQRRPSAVVVLFERRQWPWCQCYRCLHSERERLHGQQRLRWRLRSRHTFENLAAPRWRRGEFNGTPAPSCIVQWLNAYGSRPMPSRYRLVCVVAHAGAAGHRGAIGLSRTPAGWLVHDGWMHLHLHL